MFWDLIATIAAGICAAGVMLIVARTSRGRVPRWAVPVGAGLAMIAYAVWSEYSWADRTVAALPDGFDHVESFESRMIWKPWTYLVPQTTRFIAADTAAARTNPDMPGKVLVTLYFFARWQPVRSVPQLIDCAEPARADIRDAATLSGEIPADAWESLSPDDPLIETICKS